MDKGEDLWLKENVRTDRRKGWIGNIIGKDGDGQKGGQRNKGGGQTQVTDKPPPLNTPLVRMDKGTIRLRWIYKVMIASTF